MESSVELGFELKTVMIPMAVITPRELLPKEVRKSKKYRQIAASIKHLGLVEPLAVSPVGDGTFLILDGALRFDILKQRKEREVRCIFATDDEGYTYNKRVSRLSNIGEHYMILKALSNGVSEKEIAASLDVDAETIREKKSLLDGLCPEVIALLTRQRVARATYKVLRKMKPLGQIQAAERMINANNYTVRIAKALLTITKSELLIDVEKVSRSSPDTDAKIAVLQQESDALLTDLKQVEEKFATQTLDLTLGLGYMERLLANSRVEKYLAKHHGDILNEFRNLSLEKAEKMTRIVQDQAHGSPRRDGH